MKKFKNILGFFALLAVTVGCSLEEGIDQDTSFLETVNTENIGAVFAITNDNTGIVTITPTGEGVTLYTVDFGDGSSISDAIRVGESVQHAYAEGNYEVVIIAKNLAGETFQGTQPLTVSFRAPENLEVNIGRDPEDNYTVNVSASADYAAMFNVYFGETADEEPTPLMPGESVSYTYSTIGTYNVRVVAHSGGEPTIETTEEVIITDPLFFPVDFESAKLDYTWGGFGGANAQVIDNPDMSGINTSSKVVELIEDAGAQTWAGISLQLDEPLDFSQGTAVRMNVWSPEAGVPVMLKIEDSSSEPDANGNPSVFVEIIEYTTTSGEWEEMTFDLSSEPSFDPTINYDRAIIFYDFGNPGEGTTFYIDDLRLVKLEMIKFPLSFENATMTYGWVGFGGAEGSVVANPGKTGMNTSDFVTKLTKGEGAQTWAGISLPLDEPVDLSAGTTVKMKVWSPKAGASILFKLEDTSSPPDGNGNPSVVAEVFVNTTTTGAWEELSFDLTTFEAFDPSIDYDNLVIFYDFGVAGTGTDFYFDDIRIVNPNVSVLDLPITFESETLDYSFFNFGPDVADGVAIVDNPDPNDVNPSEMVAEYTKPAGSEIWAGTFLELDEPIDFSTQTKVSVDVWSPIAGAPINLKIENSDDNSIADEDVVNTTVSGQWETLTFDLSGVDPSKVYDKVVLFFNFNVAGTGETYYFDNIRLTN